MTGSPACALILSAPFLLVNLLDGITKPELAAFAHLYWSYDVTKWVLLPATTLFALRIWCGSRASAYGLQIPGRQHSLGALWALCVLYVALSMSYFGFQ